MLLTTKTQRSQSFFFVDTKKDSVSFAVSHRRAAGLGGANGVSLW